MLGKFRKICVPVLVLLLLLVVSTLVGCHANIMGTESERTVEFTVIGNDEVPEEFKKQIDESKTNVMKLTYKDDEYLYIAQGYGTKDTGGYSITVDELYVQGKTIYFKSGLIAPSESEKVSNQPSYPYIVVKTELSEMPVVFK